jgi:hypothetical protein
LNLRILNLKNLEFHFFLSIFQKIFFKISFGEAGWCRNMKAQSKNS